MTRRVWWLAGIVLGAGALWFGLGRTPPVDVETAAASIGALRVSVTEAGTTRVRAHADVNAPAMGRWVPGAKVAGDPVQAGTVLGALYPAPMDAAAQAQVRARLGAAEAAQREADTHVTAAQSALAEASRDLQRSEQLLAGGAIAPQGVERARDALTARRSDLEAARMRVRAASFDLSSARALVAPLSGNRSALTIVAPVPGAVLRVYEEHERVVQPGQPLMEVGDPGNLEAVIPLLTSDAARVRPGNTVIMTVGRQSADRADTLRGTVTRVEPSAFTKVSALGVEEQRVNVIASAPTRDAGLHIGDQYRVQASVIVTEIPSALRVPGGALVRDGERWFVYVVRDGHARRQPVTIGERGDDFVQVREGLASGDVVVVYPGDKVVDGVRVRVRK